MVIAAAGGLGSAITRAALRAGNYSVSVLVRSSDHLAERIRIPSAAEALSGVFIGSAADHDFVSHTLREGAFDAVALAVGAQAPDVVKTVVSAVAAANPQPVLLATGGTPALVMADGRTSAVEGAFGGSSWAHGLARFHVGITLNSLQASSINRWTMVCPGPMKATENGAPPRLHRWRPNVIDPSVAADALAYDDVAEACVAVVGDLLVGGNAYNHGRIAFTAKAEL